MQFVKNILAAAVVDRQHIRWMHCTSSQGCRWLFEFWNGIVEPTIQITMIELYDERRAPTKHILHEKYTRKKYKTTDTEQQRKKSKNSSNLVQRPNDKQLNNTNYVHWSFAYISHDKIFITDRLFYVLLSFVTWNYRLFCFCCIFVLHLRWSTLKSTQAHTIVSDHIWTDV